MIEELAKFEKNGNDRGTTEGGAAPTEAASSQPNMQQHQPTMQSQTNTQQSRTLQQEEQQDKRDPKSETIEVILERSFMKRLEGNKREHCSLGHFLETPIFCHSSTT